MKKVQEKLLKIANKRLLVVFPHPDDESVMAGGLILEAINKGFEVKVVSLTEGGRGRVHIHGRGRSVPEMRREEFVQAMKIMGVEDYEMWKEEDGKLRESELWKIRVSRVVERFNPGLVVSYDLSGVTGHPDHIALGVEILRLQKKRKYDLWWPSPGGKTAERFINRKVKKYINRPELSLLMNYQLSFTKWRAVYEHKSQGMDKEFVLPFWMTAFFEKEERFSVAKNKKYKYKRIKFKI